MKKLFTILVLLFTFSANAQDCLTPEPTSYNKMDPSANQAIETGNICINAKFFIVRETNGTNTSGFQPSSVPGIVNLLNLRLNPHGITVNSIGTAYFDNSTYNNGTSVSTASVMSPNAINIFIVKSISSNGNNVGGYAMSIPGIKLTITSNLTNSYHIVHEFGHCLNLLHTFSCSSCINGSPSTCTPENPNGSNSETAGDFVADTPADFYKDTKPGCANWNPPFPASSYNPDPTNIMSYKFFNSPDHFTIKQGLRMRNALMNSNTLRPVLNYQCRPISGPSTICSSSTYTFSVLAYNTSTPQVFNWTVTGNLEIIGPSNGPSITVQTSGPISSGEYGTVYMTINGQTYTKNIIIGSPIFNQFTYGGKTTATCIAPVSSYSYSIPQLNINSRVNASFFGMSSSEINTASNWEWAPFNDLITLEGSKNYRTICPMGAGQTGISVRALNGCDWSDWFYLPFEITENQDPWGFGKNNDSKSNDAELIKFYPNPSDNVINVSLDFTKYNTKMIKGEVYDMLGCLKKSIELTESQSNFFVQDLSKGVYIIKLDLNGIIENYPIIVN